MKKLLLITACISLVIVSLSVAYYLVIFLPQKQKADESLKTEIKKLQQEVSNTKDSIDNMGSNTNTDDIKYQLEDVQNSIDQQKEDQEYENQRRAWCEEGGGTYYGNGSCITRNK